MTRWILVVYLIVVVSFVLGAHEFDQMIRQEDGSLIRNRPLVDKMIHDEEVEHQIKAFMDLRIPKDLTDRLLSLSVEQEIGDVCNITNLLDPNLPKPDFFVIGQTIPSATEILNIFRSHPRFVFPDKLDPNFFGFPSSSAEDYQSHFKNINPGIGGAPQLYGDFSSEYLYHPLAPIRISKSINNPKVIIILRNPIDRAYTRYLQLTSKQGEPLPFELIAQNEFDELEGLRTAMRHCFNSCSMQACMEKIREVPVSRHNIQQSKYYIRTPMDLKQYFRSSLLFNSLYDDITERWIQVLGKHNVLVLFHEDFYYNPHTCLNQIADFLVIDDFPMQEDFKIPMVDELEIRWDPLNDKTFDTLIDFLAPFNDRLFNMVNRHDTDWKYHRSKVPNRK